MLKTASEVMKKYCVLRTWDKEKDCDVYDCYGKELENIIKDLNHNGFKLNKYELEDCEGLSILSIDECDITRIKGEKNETN